MGTSMESIQYAYQGFAKQNYTMLDNLKLGYGGTQAEMARLINDSGVLGDTMEVTAKTVNQVSFDKVIEAIHVVQERMGITGTTAKEAAETIEGSVNSAKAAWENLVAGLGNENADLDRLVTNLIDSVETAAGNIVPRIVQIISGMGEAFSLAVPKFEQIGGQLINSLLRGLSGNTETFIISGANLISQFVQYVANNLGNVVSVGMLIISKIGEGIIQALPEIISSAPTIISSLQEGLSTSISQIQETGAEVISNLKTSIIENAPQIGESGIQLITQIIQGVTNGLPEMASIAAQVVSDFASNVLSNAPSLLSSGMEIITSLIDGVSNNVNKIDNAARESIVAFAEGIADNVSKIMETAPEIIESLAKGITENLPKIAESAVSVVENFVNSVGENLPKALDAGIKIVTNLVTGIVSNTPKVIASILKIIISIVSTIAANGPKITACGIKLIGSLVSGIIGAIPTVLGAIAQIISSMISTFFNTDWISVGKNIVLGLANGIKNAIGSAVSAVGDVADAVINKAKSILGIQSPSTVFRDVIGKMIVLGIGEGIKKEMPSLNTKLKRYMLGLVDSANSATKSLAENTADIFTKATTDKFKELEKVYEEATENAKKSAQKQFDLFDDLAEKSKKSTSKTKESSSDLIQSFQAQEQYWNKLADNIDNLTSRNIDGLDKLVEAMNDGSEKGSEAISYLAAKSDEELGDIVSRYNDLEAAQERWAISSTEAKKSTDELYAALEKLGVSQNTLSAATKEGSVNQELYNIYAEAAVEKLNELDKAYQDAAASALSSAQKQFKLWDDLSEKSEESTVDLVKSLKAQEDYWNALSDNVENLTTRNIKGLTEMVNAMNDGSQKGAQYIAQLAGKSDPELKKLIQQYEQTKNAQESWANASANALTSYQSKVDETIDAFQQSVQKMNMADQATQAGQMTMQGFINGLNSQAPSVNSTISTIASAAWGVFQNVLRMHSPSKLFEQGGKWTMEGYGIGVDEESKNVNKIMEEAAETAATSFNDNNNVNVPDISKLAITDDLQALVMKANEAVAAEVSGFTGKVSLAADARHRTNSEPQNITNDNGIVVNLYYYGTGEPTDIKRISRQIGIEAAKEMRSRGVLA